MKTAVTFPKAMRDWLDREVAEGRAVSVPELIRHLVGNAMSGAVPENAIPREVLAERRVPSRRKASPQAVPDFSEMADEAVVAWLELNGFAPSVGRVSDDSPTYHFRYAVLNVNGVRSLETAKCMNENFGKFVSRETVPLAMLRQQCEKAMRERADSLST